MNRLSLFLVLLMLSSCAATRALRLPDMAEGTPIAPALRDQTRLHCENMFVHGSWQFVHSVSFEMASGPGATVLGVTVREGESLKTALMTVEGFVLFEAVLDGEKRLQVTRALPPFDNGEFARRLMMDVQDIFPRPGSRDPLLFRSAAGDLLCRYVKVNGEIRDIAGAGEDSLTSHIYGADAQELKTITAGGFSPVAEVLIPHTIQLRVSGIRGYSLTMTLLSAEKIP